MRVALVAIALLAASAAGCDGASSQAGGTTSTSSSASSSATGPAECLPLDWFGCSDTHACCEGSRCFAPQERCIDAACIDYGATCSATSCCPSRKCFEGALCCNPVARDPCTNDAECCTDRCDPKSHRCACSPPGGACAFMEGDCCGGAIGICKAATLDAVVGTCCVDFQGPCKGDADCCSNICGGGHCQ